MKTKDYRIMIHKIISVIGLSTYEFQIYSMVLGKVKTIQDINKPIVDRLSI